MEKILKVLPSAVAAEIREMARGSASFFAELSEIRLRHPGACAIVQNGQNRLLTTAVNEELLMQTVEKLCHGSLYAYREAMANGYLPFEGGVRVGVAGTARYIDGKLFGISEILGLCFRIPHEKCDTLSALLTAWEKTKYGLLIYAPPGIGKTTALKALARSVGSGAKAKRVTVLDERYEFEPSLFLGTTVDLLRGYKRDAGLEIALRTLSPEVIVMDEIGGEEEAQKLLRLCKSGVPIVATAHAGSEEEIKSKPSLLPFFKFSVFDVYAEIQKTPHGYSLSYWSPAV